MADQSPPPSKRQKVETAENVPVAPSSPPTTPLVSKSKGSRRVIPDTPESPAVQVLASSPAPNANNIFNNATCPVRNGPKHPRMVNGYNEQASITAAAVAEAMKLANSQYTPGVSIRPSGFPSPSPKSLQSVIPQSPPNILPQLQPQLQQPFSNFVAQYSFNPALSPMIVTPGAHPSPLAYRPSPTSMASAYGVSNRPRPIQAKPSLYQPRPGPQLDTRPKEGTPLRRLVDMFPHISELQGINALTACRGNFDDAAARISENPMYGVPAPPPQQLQAYPPVGVAIPAPNYGRPPPIAIQPTTKRTLKAPQQTIQQKYTHLNQQNYVPNLFPYNLPGGG